MSLGNFSKNSGRMSDDVENNVLIRNLKSPRLHNLAGLEYEDWVTLYDG